MDFSRYNNNRHFLLDTLPLDGVYFSWYFPDVGGQGQQKSGQLCLVLVRPDSQTTDRVFLKIRTPDRIETDRIRTDRHRTEFLQNSGQNPDRQTPDKESGQNPDSGQTPDRSVRKIPSTDRFESSTEETVRGLSAPVSMSGIRVVGKGSWKK